MFQGRRALVLSAALLLGACSAADMDDAMSSVGLGSGNVTDVAADAAAPDATAESRPLSDDARPLADDDGREGETVAADNPPPQPDDEDQASRAEPSGLIDYAPAVIRSDGEEGPVAEIALSPNQPADGAAAPRRRYQVQLASYGSREAARRGWLTLRRMAPELLGDVDHSVEVARVGSDETVYYRLRTTPFADGQEAEDLCARLDARDIDCLVVEYADSPTS